eukprot:TRINITY_DN1912_c0_g1_i4.p1 TRINITY_DN1912_c0_g1~~TRINITY_DN1912_c0_g1_i4.p1  ORF type:complete len:137 (+),score=32.95 TRINITY_DN1912_c0_g1_i4:109-519(+)
MIRRPPRSTLSSSSAASDVYKRQVSTQSTGARGTVSMEYFIVELEVAPEEAHASRGHLFLGVSETGISFCDAEKNELRSFNFTDISSWAATKTNFAFTHGTVEKVSKFVFATEQAPEISDTVRAKVNAAYAKLLSK